MKKLLLLLLFFAWISHQAHAQFRLIIDAPASIAHEIVEFGKLMPNNGSWGINMDTVQRFSAPFFCVSDTFACDAQPAGSMTGKIAIIQRGKCALELKVHNCQEAGAVGVLMAWVPSDIILPVGPGSLALEVHIPAVIVLVDTINAMRPDICGGSVIIGNEPTWVKPSLHASSPTIYPQPSRDRFRIANLGREAQVSLLDAAGRQVKAWAGIATRQELSLVDVMPG